MVASRAFYFPNTEFLHGSYDDLRLGKLLSDSIDLCIFSSYFPLCTGVSNDHAGNGLQGLESWPSSLHMAGHTAREREKRKRREKPQKAPCSGGSGSKAEPVQQTSVGPDLNRCGHAPHRAVSTT